MSLLVFEVACALLTGRGRWHISLRQLAIGSVAATAPFAIGSWSARLSADGHPTRGNYRMKVEKPGNTQYYSNLTRFLHLVTVMAVTAALVISLFMTYPKGGKPGDFWFEVHEKAGLVALGGLVLFWLWAVFRRREPSLGDWFPYLSGRRLAALWADTKAHLAILRGGKLPISDDQPLANAFHGLGVVHHVGKIM